MKSLVLPDGIRARFREPLGRIIPDAECGRDEILDIIGDSDTVTVGDATTRRILSLGIVPVLQIIDGMTRRGRCAVPEALPGIRDIRCENPASRITESGMRAVQEGLAAKEPVRIIVDGEEDLLVLPVCLHADDDTLILYGQPGEGLVIVRMDKITRDKVGALISMMDGGV